MNIQKMRAEKPCRTPPSEFQKEPYGVSYSPKPFPSQNLKIWEQDRILDPQVDNLARRPFWPQKSDTFLDTSKTTKPRDIHIQVRRALLYRVPRNNATFHNKIQPPMERFHFVLAKMPRFGLQLFWFFHKKPGLSAGKTCVVSAGKTSVGARFAAAPVWTMTRVNEKGMSWQTADLLSADSTDVLAADTTDVLPADTTHVLLASNSVL